jgi:hypothetical protein
MPIADDDPPFSLIIYFCKASFDILLRPCASTYLRQYLFMDGHYLINAAASERNCL